MGDAVTPYPSDERIDPDDPDLIHTFITALDEYRKANGLHHDHPLVVRAPATPLTRAWVKPAELHHANIEFVAAGGGSYLIYAAGSLVEDPEGALDLGVTGPTSHPSVHADVTDALGDLLVDDLDMDRLTGAHIDVFARTLVDYLAGRGLTIRRFDRTMQTRAAEWRTNTHPDSTVFAVTTKLAEECGEVARAVGGISEGRPDRGDPVIESAQVVVVLLSLIGQYFPNFDLLDAVANELDRLGA